MKYLNFASLLVLSLAACSDSDLGAPIGRDIPSETAEFVAAMQTPNHVGWVVKAALTSEAEVNETEGRPELVAAAVCDLYRRGNAIIKAFHYPLKDAMSQEKGCINRATQIKALGGDPRPMELERQKWLHVIRLLEHHRDRITAGRSVDCVVDDFPPK